MAPSRDEMLRRAVVEIAGRCPRLVRQCHWAEGALHSLVEAHLEELIESFRDPNEPDAAIPAFVEKEFRAYLACGDPSRGFIRLYCDRCQHEHVLPFSCKGRAICPSCAARRTTATASHLVEPRPP